MRAISVDLRRRACEAVETEGLSCRAAAARFKVGVSSVIRWCAQLRQTGAVAPRKQGGDRRSGRIEAQAPFSAPSHRVTSATSGRRSPMHCRASPRRSVKIFPDGWLRPTLIGKGSRSSISP